MKKSYRDKEALFFLYLNNKVKKRESLFIIIIFLFISLLFEIISIKGVLSGLNVGIVVISLILSISFLYLIWFFLRQLHELVYLKKTKNYHPDVIKLEKQLKNSDEKVVSNNSLETKYSKDELYKFFNFYLKKYLMKIDSSNFIKLFDTENNVEIIELSRLEIDDLIYFFKYLKSKNVILNSDTNLAKIINRLINNSLSTESIRKILSKNSKKTLSKKIQKELNFYLK